MLNRVRCPRCFGSGRILLGPPYPLVPVGGFKSPDEMREFIGNLPEYILERLAREFEEEDADGGDDDAKKDVEEEGDDFFADLFEVGADEVPDDPAYYLKPGDYDVCRRCFGFMQIPDDLYAKMEAGADVVGLPADLAEIERLPTQQRNFLLATQTVLRSSFAQFREWEREGDPNEPSPEQT